MRLNQMLRATASAAVVGAVAFGFAGTAAAQTAPQAGPTTVDDIIVTAQKREQNLQDVPIVVTSLSAEALEDAGVRDIKDLQVLTPGLTVTSTTSEASTTARIRGVGTVGDNPGLESSVGVVIDGVYRSRNGVGFGDLGELERVEVLKGPQGTLFGKNTSAGVINILTAAPSFNFGVSAQATMGNYGAMNMSGSITGPITDQLAFRIYGGRGLRDGYNDIDLGDGPRIRQDDADQDFWTLRGQLLWLPSDDLSVRAIADFSRRDEFCCVGPQIRTGPTYPFIDALSNGTGQRPPAPGFGMLPFSRQAYANRGSEQEIEDKGVSIETNLDLTAFGGATLTAITSYRDWSTVNGQDADFTGADIAYRLNDGEFANEVENLTQEVRLAGSTDRLDWLVGAFATKEDIIRRDSFYLGADYNPVLSYQLTANLNAASPLVQISPSSIPCFTAPYLAGETLAQRATRIGQCLGTGGAVGGAGGPVPTAGQALRDYYEQNTKSFAVFTNNSFDLTDQLELTLGLRYTWDDKSLIVQQRNVGTSSATCGVGNPAAGGGLANFSAIAAALGGGTAGQAAAGAIVARLCLPWTNPFFANRNVNESFDNGELSGTFKAAYRLNDQILAYASYARGYKSFGYNMDRVQGTVPPTPQASLLFPSENVDSYELGVKTTLFDRTVLLNATYFEQNFEDFQLNTFLGTAFVVESIPELKSKGVDADFLWFTPVDGLSFQGGLTYTDTKYGQFTAADLTNPANFPGLSLLPGARASFAPEWSGTASVNFERGVGNGLKAGFSLAAKYQTEYNTGSDLLPWKQQDAFTTVNGRIKFGAEDDRWTFEVWGQNLTDEEYIQVAYNGFLQGSGFQSTPTATGPYAGTYYNPALDSQTIDAFLGAPRTYGATFRFKY